MAKKRAADRVLILYDGNSSGALRDIERGRWRDERLYEPPRRDRSLDAQETIGATGLQVDTIEVMHSSAKTDLPNVKYSDYSVVCLCLHGGGERDVFELLVTKCQEAGAVPIGVADSTYYSSECVVPEVQGLKRCLSRDLVEMIKSRI